MPPSPNAICWDPRTRGIIVPCQVSVADPQLAISPSSFALQISRLEQTWMVLRQRYTEGAILYEKKLKPFLKSLNEGKGEPGSFS